jgi:hypothetical protein
MASAIESFRKLKTFYTGHISALTENLKNITRRYEESEAQRLACQLRLDEVLSQPSMEELLQSKAAAEMRLSQLELEIASLKAESTELASLVEAEVSLSFTTETAVEPHLGVLEPAGMLSTEVKLEAAPEVLEEKKLEVRPEVSNVVDAPTIAEVMTSDQAMVAVNTVLS